MGQYYRVLLVNDLWEEKIVQPSGLKQLEHGYYFTDTMQRIERLLYWEGQHCYWIWDYSDIADRVRQTEEFEDVYEEYYHAGDLLNKKGDSQYYLVNEDKKEFINMRKQREDQSLWDHFWWIIHPLVVLCRAEGDFGGWDYRVGLNVDKQGTRCGDKIAVKEFAWNVDDKLIENWYKDMTEAYKFKEGHDKYSFKETC